MDNDGSRRLSVREFQVIGPLQRRRGGHTWTCCSVERRLDDVWQTVVFKLGIKNGLGIFYKWHAFRLERWKAKVTYIFHTNGYYAYVNAHLPDNSSSCNTAWVCTSWVPSSYICRLAGWNAWSSGIREMGLVWPAARRMYISDVKVYKAKTKVLPEPRGLIGRRWSPFQ